MSDLVYPALAGALIDVERSSIYDTTVQREASGRELRIARQTAARYRWRIRYDFLRQDSGGDELETLLAFMASHKGAWDSFLLVDPKGSTVTTKWFGTGNGTNTIFYLRDEYGDRIGYPNLVTSIYVAGVLKSFGVDYTYDFTTGRVAFTAAPAGGAQLTWTGSYYRRVRFAADELSITRRFSRVWQAEVELLGVLP